MTGSKVGLTRGLRIPVGEGLGLLPLSGVFLFALLFTLINYFAFQHVHSTFMFDGWLYKWTIGRVADFLTAVAHGHLNPALVSDAQFSGRIVNDGAVLPLFYGSIFAVLGHSPAPEDWRIFVVIQCVLHALSSCLVAALSFRFHQSRLWSLVSAALWALYPAAVIAAGILYTEPLTVFLILALVWASTGKGPTAAKAVLTGGLSAALFLAKPALIPALFASLVCTILFASRKKLVAGAICLCIALAIGCWGSCTRALTGTFSVTTQRYAALNGAVGWDTESDGWIVSDYMPLTDLLMRSGPPGTGIMAQWMVHTRECLALTARKLTRMYALPWNDFRDNVWGIKPEVLVSGHLALLYFAIFGIVLYAAGGYRKLGADSRLVANCCLIWMLGHLIYMLFQSMERYAFTGTPFWAVFAGYGLWRATTALRNSKRSAAYVSACAIAAMLLATIVVSASNLTRLGDNHEIGHLLQPGGSAVKEITLTACQPPASIATAIILVDAEKNIEQATLEINGHKIDGSLRSLMSVDDHYFTDSRALATLSHAQAISSADLRQWRAVQIPSAWVNLSQPNIIKIEQHGVASTIFGDSNPNYRRMFSTGSWLTEPLNMLDDRSRLIDPITTAHVRQSSSVEDPGAGRRRRELPDSLRIKLGLLPGVPSNGGRQTVIESLGKPVHIQIPVSDFDYVLWWSNPHELGINRRSLQASKTTSCKVKIPRLPASSHIRITFSGEVKAMHENSRCSLVADYLHPSGALCMLPAIPDYLVAGTSWKRFEITDLVPVACLGKDYLDLVLFPDSWIEVSNYGCDRGSSEAFFRNLSVEFSACKQPSVRSDKMLYY